MNITKKWLSLLLAIVLVVSLFAGCASGTDATEPSTDSTQSSSENTESSANEETTEGTKETEHTHTWADATCTAPKTCSDCGETEGEALGHTWTDATCTAPKTCGTCGVTEGEAKGHSWVDATCTAPKTCATCGVTEGNAKGHSWNDATCTAPKTCKTCGATDGNAKGHSWNNATCTAPKTCKTCGATDGNAKGHSWNNATCAAPKTCGTCGATEGEKAAHNYVDGACSVCGGSIYNDPTKLLMDTAYMFYDPYVISMGIVKHVIKYSLVFTADGSCTIISDKYEDYDQGLGSTIVYEGETWYYQERTDTIDCTWTVDGNSIVVTRKDNGWHNATLTLQENGELLTLESNFLYGNAKFSTNPS